MESSTAEPTEEHYIQEESIKLCSIPVGCQIYMSPLLGQQGVAATSPQLVDLKVQVSPADVSVNKALSHLPAPGELWDCPHQKKNTALLVCSKSYNNLHAYIYKNIF